MIQNILNTLKMRLNEEEELVVDQLKYKRNHFVNVIKW